MGSLGSAVLMFGDAAFGSRPFADGGAVFGLAASSAEASATFDYVIYAATRQFATEPADSVTRQTSPDTLTQPLVHCLPLTGMP